jgi:hypothetical protein
MRRIAAVALASALALAGAANIAGAPAQTSAQLGGSLGDCPVHYGTSKTRAYARYTFATHRRQHLREAHLARMIRCQHVPARTPALRRYRAQLFALWRVECPGWDRVGGASVFEAAAGYGIATRSYVNPTGLWVLRSPNGVATIQRQTDWGPGITSREFDLTEDAANAHGYSYDGFPTDQGTWAGRFIGYRLPAGLHYGKITMICP